MLTVKAYTGLSSTYKNNNAETLYDFLRLNGLEEFAFVQEEDRYKYYLNSDPIQLSEYILDDGLLEILPNIRGGDANGGDPTGGGGGGTPSPTYVSSTLTSAVKFWVVLAPNGTNSGYPCPNLAANIYVYSSQSTSTADPTTSSTPMALNATPASYASSVPSRIGIGARNAAVIKNLRVYTTPLSTLNPANISLNNYTPVAYNDSMRDSVSTSQSEVFGHAYLGNDINYNISEVIT
jgi:hypothetical protein